MPPTPYSCAGVLLPSDFQIRSWQMSSAKLIKPNWMGWSPNEPSDLIKGDIWTQPDTQGNTTGKMKAEITVMPLQATDHQRWPAMPQKPGEDLEPCLPHSAQKKPNLPTPRSQISRPQSCETIHFICLSPSVVELCYGKPRKPIYIPTHFFDIKG